MRKKSIFWFFISVLVFFILILIAICILFIVNDFSFSEYLDRLPSILKQLIREPLFWIFLSIPYFIIRLIRFWILGFRSGGFTRFSKRFGYSFALPVILIILLIRWSVWHQNSEEFDYDWDKSVYNQADSSQLFHLSDQRIRGMHVFGKIDSTKLQKLVPGNIEHIVLVPYAYQEDYNTPDLSYGSASGTRRDSIYNTYINVSERKGLKVIFKPHIWITNPSDGKWRADIEMENEEAWKEWETRYESFILHFAALSERYKLPYFCIGNEYHISTRDRPEFWTSLIQKIRKVYTGKLTYGANWDREYLDISFWNELDYIGIQAYFPLADKNYPSYSEVNVGWDKHLQEIDSISEIYGKKVIFTELGYKSTPDAAQYPWGWESFAENIFQQISTRTQSYCYQAFFEKVWPKEWMAGVMVWQWQTSGRDNDKNHNFTPEGKPAFNEIAKGFYSDPIQLN